jgi:hypothetical protein
MMHFEQSNFALFTRFKLNIIIALIVAQPVLFFYLLALDLTAIFFMALLCVIPIVFFGSLLLTRKVKLRYTKMSLVMFAAGGFGMLFGSVVDLGPVGVYGLLSICQLTPFPVSGWGVSELLQRIQLTPWTYIGMFTCGNLGMLFLDDLRSSHSLAPIKVLYIYLICNIGMLFGMLLGESISTIFIIYLNQFLAAGLMISSMLLGMVFGMVGFMALANKLTKHTLLPFSFNYGTRVYDTVNRSL